MSHPSIPCLILFAVGCNIGGADLTPLEGSGEHASGKILGGSAPDAAEHDAVVALHELNRSGRPYVEPFCTGTLIREDVVLTAAHCLEGMSASDMAVYVGDDPRADMRYHLYDVSEISSHPDYDSWNILNDIGLVRLSSAITEGYTPVPELPASDELTTSDLGSTVNFAGFGDDGMGGYGVKLQVDGTIDAFGCGVSGCWGTSDTDTQISYEQRTTGPCMGDSGGPMFVYRSGVAYVAGITSYGDYWCAQYGVSTRVDAFEDFVTAFADELEDTGDFAPVCGDSVCDVGESCDGRDGTDRCRSDCHGRFRGPPSVQFCYVDGAGEGAGCP